MSSRTSSGNINLSVNCFRTSVNVEPRPSILHCSVWEEDAQCFSSSVVKGQGRQIAGKRCRQDTDYTESCRILELGTIDHHIKRMMPIVIQGQISRCAIGIWMSFPLWYLGYIFTIGACYTKKRSQTKMLFIYTINQMQWLMT